jgi:precorrin-3B synthase
MAQAGFSGTAHLSGCAKGCASSSRADLTLIGAPGGYRLLRDATARDEGGAFISPADIGEGILHG